PTTNTVLTQVLAKGGTRMKMDSSIDSILNRIESDVKNDFERTNRILTFEEYLTLLSSDPRTHARGSAQYVVDMMDHFGKVETRGGVHFRLFDMDFGGDSGDVRHRVIAQNHVQHEIYRALKNFVKEGVNNKL